MGLLKDYRTKLEMALFLVRGSKPWTRGYNEYKLHSINKILADKSFNYKKLDVGYGYRLDERVVEYPWLFSRMSKVSGNLLDAGSILNYEYLLNQPELKEKRIFISTLAPEATCFWSKGVSYIFEDLRNSSFKEEFFDTIVSISTIEHIGLDNTMLYTNDSSKHENVGMSCLAAIKEYKRMLKSGGVLYLSFPFGVHQNHGWFQIFNAVMLDEVIATFNPSSYEEFHFKYSPEGWITSTRELSKNATYFDIHKQTSYDADYAAASRAVVCLELIK